MSRCFVFGCSFVRFHISPTWADIVGSNFDEFHNLGQSGISNQIMMNRFIEADAKFKFNSEDTVLISLTGVGRHGFLIEQNKNTGWLAQGDLQNDLSDGWIFRPTSPVLDQKEVITFMRDKYWKRKWGIYYIWLAVKTMKRVLESNNVKHKIFMSLDNSLYRDRELLALSDQESRMIEEVYSLMDLDISIQEFNEQRPEYEPEKRETHPDIDGYMDFIKAHLPEYNTDKSKFYVDQMKAFMKRAGNAFTMEDHRPLNKFFYGYYT